MSFGRFPSAWVMSDGLRQFSARKRPGEHIAALKLYLVVAAYSDFKSWMSTLSLSDLENITKLSRPMLIGGSRILEQNCLISKGRLRQTATYTMKPEGAEPRWAKVPEDAIRRGMRSIPNRGRSALASLRIYTLFLAMRDNKTCEAKLSYKTIASYTGVRPADIRHSVSLLVNAGFLNVIQAEYDYDEEKISHNIYVLSGDFSGKMRRQWRPDIQIPHDAGNAVVSDNDVPF